jgi:hypothetical protein
MVKERRKRLIRHLIKHRRKCERAAEFGLSGSPQSENIEKVEENEYGHQDSGYENSSD